jgi:hypothetical protein
MKEIVIEKVVDDARFSGQMTGGKLYFLFSSVPDIQQQLFSDYRTEVSFMNSPFNEAIKVPHYIKKGNFTEQRIQYLEQVQNVTLREPNAYKLIDQIILVMLDQLLDKDILVVEAAGVSVDSIEYCAKVSKELLAGKENKIIVIVLIQPFGKICPKIKIEEVTAENLNSFYTWFEEMES